MKIYTLTTEQWLPAPVDKVFAFFGDARNLQVLTPPWLHFQILSPITDAVHQGMEIAYRIRWRWVPIRWLTTIAVWEPSTRFVDQQAKGPYKQWIHEHTFEEKDGGTLARDRVDYALPGWIFGRLMHRLIVHRDLQQIFDYRQSKMKEIFQEDQ